MIRKTHTGLTLVELIISIVIISILLVVLGRFYLLIYSRVAEEMKINDLHLQMDYALENLRLHCPSAIRLEPDSVFTSGTTSSKPQFAFEAESDIYRITPDNLTDNAQYKYWVNTTSGALALVTNNSAEETLVQARFRPRIEFTYSEGAEPNFLTVTVSAEHNKVVFSKTQGLRLWFIDAVK